MKKLSKRSIDYVLDALKVLADNPYSLLWELTDDFECNGHEVSVKDSTQYQQAVIDGRYQHIGGNVSITAGGKTYRNPLDYVKDLLLDQVGKTTERIDFGTGTRKEIREAIAGVSSLKEDKAIKVFSSGSPEYLRLEAAAGLLTAFTGKSHYVGETYFDYGQGWKWTTVLRESAEWGGVQVFMPKDQENVLNASNASELGKAVDKVINS